MQGKKIALVTGATGGVGGEVALALIRHGWTVRGLARDTAKAQPGSQIEWITGDAMSRVDVVAAATGASVVFHGANPPAYNNWRELAIPMLENSIAACEQVGARLIYPGSVYVYGADAGEVAAEHAPQNPITRKGKIRVEMEQMLHASVLAGGRTLVLRAGDFFGPRAPSSWVSAALLANGAPIKAVKTPEIIGARHAWAYLPDVAEAIALLADLEQSLAAKASYHFSGHALADQQMAQSVQRVCGTDLPIRSFSWLPIYLAAPFVTFCREVIEMRYLWTSSLHLDNSQLVKLLGYEPRTDLDQAVRASAAALRTGHQNATSINTAPDPTASL